jgi:hypothetical protein
MAGNKATTRISRAANKPGISSVEITNLRLGKRYFVMSADDQGDVENTFSNQAIMFIL